MSEQRNILLLKVRGIIGDCKDYQYWLTGITIDSIPKEKTDQCIALGFTGYSVVESQLEIAASTKKKEYKASFNHMSRALAGYCEYRFPADASFSGVEFEDDFIVYSNGKTHLVSDTNPMTVPVRMPVVKNEVQPVDLPRVSEEDKFVGEMILFTKPEGGKIVPKATVEIMVQAGIREPKPLDGFCRIANGIFGLLPNPCSAYAYASRIREQLSMMTYERRVEFMTIFYTSRYPVTVERVGRYLRPSVPAWSGVKPYLKDPEDIAAHPDQSTFLIREADIKDSLVPPKTTAGQISFLAAERALRGSDMSNASFFASATSRGGYVDKQRRQICDILSVVLPLQAREERRKKDKDYKVKMITVRPPVDSLIPELTLACTKYNLDKNVKFFSQSDDMYDRFPKFVIRNYEKESILVDFVGGKSVPTFEKGTDPDIVWPEMLVKHVGSRKSQLTEFYLYRKVPPQFSMPGIKVFKFHSSHSFDFFVTNATEMSAAYGKFDDKLKFSVCYRNLQAQTPASIRDNVFKDNRTRTFAVINGGYGQDLGLNLYGIECRKLTKKEMRKAVLEFSEEPDDDADELEVREILKQLKIDDDEIEKPVMIDSVSDSPGPVQEEIKFDD